MGSHQNMDQGCIAEVLGGDSPLNRSRAKSMRVRLDNPLVARLLACGSSFCKKHGLKEKRNDFHRRFAEQMGIDLRLMGEWYVHGLGKLWCDPWRVAASVFCLLFRESFPDRYMKIRCEMDKKEVQDKFPELCLPEETITYYGLVLQSCNPPILPKLNSL
jgi:hypothetical protein